LLDVPAPSRKQVAFLASCALLPNPFSSPVLFHGICGKYLISSPPCTTPFFGPIYPTPPFHRSPSPSPSSPKMENWCNLSLLFFFFFFSGLVCRGQPPFRFCSAARTKPPVSFSPVAAFRPRFRFLFVRSRLVPFLALRHAHLASRLPVAFFLPSILLPPPF